MAITGVKFGDTHSSEWGLRLKEIKMGLPDVKTEYVEVPGMNGVLDLTEVQNGGVKYGNRTLEFYFDARDCNYKEWSTLLSTIASAVHGKRINIITDIDPGYYYSGRCSLNTSKSNEVRAEIVISCECDPYKTDIAALGEQWIWDTFSFETGRIIKNTPITVNSPSGWQQVTIYGWMHNEPIQVMTDTALEMKFEDEIYELSTGVNTVYEADIKEGRNDLYFRGIGSITILQIGGMI